MTRVAGAAGPCAQVADPSLPIGMTEIGTMTSIFPIAYGFRCACGRSRAQPAHR